MDWSFILKFYQNCQLTPMNVEKIVQAHGSMRNGTVVLYGDKLSDKFYKTCEKDFKSPKNPVDLVLAMGTSLQVAPFCAIPNLVPKTASIGRPKLKSRTFLESWSTTTKLAGRDVELGSLWNSRWENELLVKSTSDNFVIQFFESSGCSTREWTLFQN